MSILNKNKQRVFEFPYQPYDIQIQLMNTLYDSFENGLVSIVESPTGTGKSLSIICAMVKWIEDFKLNEVKNLEKKIEQLKLEIINHNDTSKCNDWLSDQLKQIAVNNMINDLNVKLEKLNKHITYSKELKKKKSRILKKNLNKNRGLSNKRTHEDDDAEEVLEDLVIQFDESIGFEEKDEDKSSDYFCPKVFYCSRTHSQLSQFINEFKKTKYFKDNETSLMLIPLSSRINYCINGKINHFSNLNMINERCNDLKNSKQKCQYKNRQIEEFGQEILSNVCDLEEIVTMGKQNTTCPYYSTKVAVPNSEIIVMPYNILLHKSTREHFGIRLKNSIVIIDEAHNLLETISNVHSIEIKALQISNLLKYLSLYMTKFYNRFNALNLKFLKQLVFVVKKLFNFLNSSKENACYDPLDLSIKMNIENINIPELLQFIDRSRIASKLHMFSNKNQKNSNTKIKKTSGTMEFLKKINENNDEKETNNIESDRNEFLNLNTLHLIKDFLTSLNNYNVEAKVLISINQNDKNNSSFKYVLLNPSSHFKDILQESRSVILCGGTMKPYEDYVNQLFKPLNISTERTIFFSCNHIISDDKLIVIGCSKGPSNIRLNYSYSCRSSPEIIKETGHLLLELVQSIPKGIVIFFPSYDYQEFLIKQWEKNGILKMLEKQHKRIFKEPKKSLFVQNTLNSYAKFIRSSKESSAILFSVIGGKMSEGINFSDDLGRAVIVIGLPHANKNSIELMEKISYLNRINKNTGNEYYENLCMRAVNQSTGRAIRHKNDYAAIIFLDERYDKRSVNCKLSDWIRTRFQSIDQFNQAKLLIEKFFQNKN